MDKLKVYIFLLSPDPKFPAGDISGGLIRFIEIFKILDSKIKLHIVSTPYNIDFLKNNGLKFTTHLISSKSKYSNLIDLSLTSVILILKYIFNQSKYLSPSPDRIYSTSDLFWETIPAFFLKLKYKQKIKWIQTIHHIYPPWYLRPGNKIVSFFGYYLQKFSHQLIKTKADKIITVNSPTRNIFINRGFPSNKILLSSNGINIQEVNRSPSSKKSYAGSFLGRLNYSKGIFDLLKIWHLVNQKLPLSTIAVIGEGPADIKNKLDQEIKSLKLKKNIKLYGFLPTAKVYFTLKKSRLFIFPSHEEGWGIAIAEAMACGLVVICWDLPNYRSVFGSHLVYIKPFDIIKFSQKIIYLLKHPQMTVRMGKQNQEFIKKYDWDHVVKNEYQFIINND